MGKKPTEEIDPKNEELDPNEPEQDPVEPEADPEPEPKPEPKKKPKAARLFNPMEGVPNPDADLSDVKKGLSDLGSKIDQLLAPKPEPKKGPKEPKEEPKKGPEKSEGRWFDEFELFPEI